MTILGIDISKWNGNWDANKAKQAGASFVFIRASQAMETDPQFLVNWQKAKDAGLLRGAYHYLDYSRPGRDQANYFADLLKNDPGELPPAINYELRRTNNDPSVALGFLRDCLDQMIKRADLFEDASVKYPMIYTGPGFWTEYGDLTKGDYWIQFPLWNVHWITSSTPIIPPPWTMWQFWQFTSKGPGEAFGSESLAINMDRFNGTLNELMEFSGIRFPAINLSEKVETLEGKIMNLEGIIATANQAGDASSTELSSRIDNLEVQISNLGSSISSLSTTLVERIAVIDQKISDFENNPSKPIIPTIPITDEIVTPIPVADPLVPSVAPPDQPVENTSLTNTFTTAICITSSLNVRSGPGASYPSVAGLRHGQRVKVIKRQNGWVQLENPAGWSSEAYLSFEQSSSPVPVEKQPVPSLPASFGICNTSGLNVRRGPGVTYPIVGGLTYGQRIKILGHSSGWAQIETPSGWCNESYVSFA
jgi:lysozyme